MLGTLVASLGLPTGPGNATLPPWPAALQPLRAPPLRTDVYQKDYTGAGVGSNVCVEPKGVTINTDGIKVVHSNLGGIGPDTGGEFLRIANMGTLSTEGATPVDFDVSITALTPYTTSNKGEVKNGVNGHFGMINVGYGTLTTFRASFIDAKTDKPVKLPSVSVGFLDMDHGEETDCTEVVRIIRDAKTFDGYWTDSGHGIPKYDWHENQENVTFSATNIGTASDNPTSPDDMSNDQWRKTFMVRYKDVSSFDFALGFMTAAWNADHTAQTLSGENCKENKGRNFQMAAQLNFFPCDAPVPTPVEHPPDDSGVTVAKSPSPPPPAPASVAPSPQWIHPECPCLTPEERASKRIQRKTHLALKDYLSSYTPEELKMTPEEHALSLKKSVLLLNDPCAPVEKVKAC